jgi:hypothetical protein
MPAARGETSTSDSPGGSTAHAQVITNASAHPPAITRRSALVPKFSAISGLATPMMMKSKPSSMIPSAASSQKRM